jgi:hypothetical protein
LQQAAYERYLTTLENSVYLTADPATAVCALPLGPENAPVVDISSPTANQSVEVGNTVTISGSVAFLESISSFTVKFDGNSIAGASMEPNGSFTVTYVIPSSTSIGIHTLNVTAVDNYGKSNSASVNINVVAAGSSISLSIISLLMVPMFQVALILLRILRGALLIAYLSLLREWRAYR